MSVRLESKRATRAKVLEAARELFERDGYDQTTIRSIADYAGVSAGSVFTTFSSKAEILSEVVRDHLESLAGELRTKMPTIKGTHSDKITALMMTCYARTCEHPGLFMAMIAQNFTWPPSPKPFYVNEGLVKGIRALAGAAVQSDPALAKVDIDALASILVAIYKANYELLFSNRMDLPSLEAHLKKQIDVVMRAPPETR